MTLTVCSSLKNGRYAKKMAPACASSSLLCSDVQKVVPCLSSSWRKRSLKSTRSRWHGRRWSPADVRWRRRWRQRSHCEIFWLRSAWERRCRAHRRLGRLSFLPWRGNRQLRRGKSLWREWTTKRWRRKQFRVGPVRESVNLDYITSPERVETWFFGFSDLSAFKIYGTSYLQKWMVVELFAHTVGVVENGPFLPNFSGPIRVNYARSQLCESVALIYPSLLASNLLQYQTALKSLIFLTAILLAVILTLLSSHE